MTMVKFICEMTMGDKKPWCSLLESPQHCENGIYSTVLDMSQKDEVMRKTRNGIL